MAAAFKAAFAFIIAAMSHRTESKARLARCKKSFTGLCPMSRRMQSEDAMELEEISAGHGTLTAVRTGKGADLVLLHSLLADRHAFDPVLPALAARHRVTLFNLPGFHGSQPTLLALMDAYVACLEDGFDELKIGRDAILDRQRLRRHRGAGLCLCPPGAHCQAGDQRCRRRLSAGGPAGLCGDGGEGCRRRARRRRRDRRQAGVLARLSCGASRGDRGAQESSDGDRAEGLSGRLQDPAGDRSDAGARQDQGADAWWCAANSTRRRRRR